MGPDDLVFPVYADEWVLTFAYGLSVLGCNIPFDGTRCYMIVNNAVMKNFETYKKVARKGHQIFMFLTPILSAWLTLVKRQFTRINNIVVLTPEVVEEYFHFLLFG